MWQIHFFVCERNHQRSSMKLSTSTLTRTYFQVFWTWSWPRCVCVPFWTNCQMDGINQMCVFVSTKLCLRTNQLRSIRYFRWSESDTLEFKFFFILAKTYFFLKTECNLLIEIPFHSFLSKSFERIPLFSPIFLQILWLLQYKVQIVRNT